jgi:endonuclease VIII
VPEGPEIRREAVALAQALVARPLTRIEYRVPRLARRARTLEGASVLSVTSHGKAMLIAYSTGLTHYSHNQLYGSWHVVTPARLATLQARRAASMRVVIATAEAAAVLMSATRIELLTERELATQPYLARLGPDVLDRTTTPRTVRTRLRDARFAKRSLAALLLDQSFLAGLGNYLRSDILHATGLRHTARPIDLDAPTIARLSRAILALPRQSFATAGTTNDRTLMKRLETQGVTLAKRRFRVYGRNGQACWFCGTTIRRVDVAGRGVYFCPRCQPA